MVIGDRAVSGKSYLRQKRSVTSKDLITVFILFNPRLFVDISKTDSNRNRNSDPDETDDRDVTG
jgi:hypothetical protein